MTAARSERLYTPSWESRELGLDDHAHVIRSSDETARAVPVRRGGRRSHGAIAPSTSLALSALAIPMLAFVLMTSMSGWDPTLHDSTLHFYLVSSASLLSGVIAGGLLILVSSIRRSRNVFLALGFLSIAMIFSAHGLGTPGFIGESHVYPTAVAVSAGLSQAVGAAFFAMGVVPGWTAAGHVIQRSRRTLAVVTPVALCAYVLVALAAPESLEIVPTTRPWENGLALTTLLLLSFAAWRYWRAWRMLRFPSQFAMVAALVLLAEAQISMHFGTLWQASWWMYHGLLLTAFLIVLAGWAAEALRSRSVVFFSRAIDLRDELDHVTLDNPDALSNLEEAMGEKDVRTQAHMGRVARYAGAIARELRLDPLTVHIIETAGRIHDIGKIVVPDVVLMKPGPLTGPEFEQLKHHAVKGAEIARSSKILGSVADIVRAHHERFAGGGYPHGLIGYDIPLAARILAVADTFDALTSARAYRDPASYRTGIAEIERVSGTQLDPRCVEAFLQWWYREQPAEELVALDARPTELVT